MLLCHATQHPAPLEKNTHTGVQLADGRRVDARVVLVNADPFRLRQLAGPANFTPKFNAWLDSLRKDGTTMKVGWRAWLAGWLRGRGWRLQSGDHGGGAGLLCLLLC
jgi:hypothetical protein